MIILGHCNLLKGKHTTGPKRPSKHEPNNATAGRTKWHGRNASKSTEGAKNGLKREKPTIRQGPVLKGSKP